MGSFVRERLRRPARALWCVGMLLAAMLPQAAMVGAQSDSPTPAQPDLPTQQRVNQRIQEMAKSAATRTSPLRDYVIGRGDLVTVEVFEVPELTRDVRVSQTGTIGLPLLPVRLFVVGLTETQAQQKIAEVLEANGLVSHPQVMVFVKEKRSKPIVVVGAVARPMVVQADRPMTLIEVLAEAGGISSDAGDTVIVTRAGVGNTQMPSEPPEIGPEDAVAVTDPSATPGSPDSGGPPQTPHGAEGSSKEPAPDARQPVAPQSAIAPQPYVAPRAAEANGGPAAATPPPVSDPGPAPNTISVNLSEILERGNTQNNIPLEAGDVVTIPHAGIVYALGAVQRPGGYVAKDDRAQLSTLKILALAGGMTRVAKRDDAIIIRKDAEGHQQSIPVPLGKIVRRETEDVRLYPSDILYVPDSHTKAALIRASEIMLGVGTSLLIYRIGQ